MRHATLRVRLVDRRGRSLDSQRSTPRHDEPHVATAHNRRSNGWTTSKSGHAVGLSAMESCRRYSAGQFASELSTGLRTNRARCDAYWRIGLDDRLARRCACLHRAPSIPRPSIFTDGRSECRATTASSFGRSRHSKLLWLSTLPSAQIRLRSMIENSRAAKPSEVAFFSSQSKHRSRT
jgi:hypothetical protein